MTIPMRETQRRKLIRKAQGRGEREAATNIHQLLDQRYKVLKRELRRANLRKRLKKTVTPNFGNIDELINRTIEKQMQQIDDALFKADGGWLGWIESFANGIKNALSNIVSGVFGVEEEYWLNRGEHLDPVDPLDVIDAYEARTGRQIRNIGEDTKNNVLREIADWYNTTESLPELIARLGQYFSESRAEMIARTESAFISSQVSLNAMQQFGIDQWNFDLAPDEGPYPCPQCIDYAARNPHGISDQFPPLHPNDRCGIVYVLEEDSAVMKALDRLVENTRRRRGIYAR